jgi:uncharacterized protein
LDRAGAALRAIQRGLELGSSDVASDENGRIVEAYNREDCTSARALRGWLERLRADAEMEHGEIARPPEESGVPSENVGAREQRARELAERLLEDVPEDGRTDEQQARWLLAHLLDWHRREEKAPWWEYFRLRDLSDEDLLDESAALAGLEFVERLSSRRTVVDRYRFQAQETAIREDGELRLPGPEGPSFGKVVAIDLSQRTVDIQKNAKFLDVHPTSVFHHKVVSAGVLAEALMRLGEWVALNGVDVPGESRAARDLLLRRRPLGGAEGVALEADGEGGVHAARRLALALDRDTLAIQRPPGSGKTYTGARMICDLARAGKRVGVCAVSHKVVTNRMREVVRAGAEEGVRVPCLRKVSEESEAPDSGISETKDNAAARAALQSGTARVVGGTPWLWARPEFFEAVDVLFVDEAGQMSLANVLAIAQSAQSIVLLGDPQQLEQPVQGFHPPGTAVSALEHVLGGAQTIPPDRGLFLEETWRLPPEICALTSELFYERRLHPRAGLERQALIGDTPFAGAGLWYVPVVHDADTLQYNAKHAPSGGFRKLHPIRGRTDLPRDARMGFVACRPAWTPGNSHGLVAIPPARLLRGRRHGRQVPGRSADRDLFDDHIDPEDAPRGMEFLYSPNRFNVATSRAKCACIVVGSPRLFEPDCQSPRQLKLANAFCRYLEAAHEVRVEQPFVAAE